MKNDENLVTKKKAPEVLDHPKNLENLELLRMIQAEHEYLCVVLLDMFYFHYYLGKIPILTNIFEMG